MLACASVAFSRALLQLASTSSLTRGFAQSCAQRVPISAFRKQVESRCERGSDLFTCGARVSTLKCHSSQPGFRYMVSATADFAAETLTGAKRKMGRKIGTHNGTFHCDEALGCFMIRLTEKFKDAEIVRTRDQKVLETLDAVLDVGGVYDPATDRYDHHQKTFSDVLGFGFSTKLSSAGLVYKHFGREIIAKEMKVAEEHPDVETVYLAVYKHFMEALDAIDNGVNQYDVDAPPKYLNSTHLSARVGHLNPGWLEEQTEENENACFRKAMALTGAEAIVARSIAARTEHHASGEIVVLKQYCPWQEHLSELEKELALDPLPKYVLYQDERSNGWRVQATRVAPGKFESRRPLPAVWRGLRDDELSALAGVPSCVFVHMSGFIGGNKTLKGALQMASKALTME
eukprot:jgi/Mesen1/8802/ME000528S08191